MGVRGPPTSRLRGCGGKGMSVTGDTGRGTWFCVAAKASAGTAFFFPMPKKPRFFLGAGDAGAYLLSRKDPAASAVPCAVDAPLVCPLTLALTVAGRDGFSLQAPPQDLSNHRLPRQPCAECLARELDRGQLVGFRLRVRVCEAACKATWSIFILVTRISKAALECARFRWSWRPPLWLLAECSGFRRGLGQRRHRRLVLGLLAEPSCR